jgi:hypothetical protein
MNRRTDLLLSPVPDNSTWYLRNYLIKADPAEMVKEDEHNARLRALIEEIDRIHLSAEFEYFRCGFVIGHLGQRGICVSVWHWGKWGSTYEIFNQSWYAYGRDYAALTLLDRKEPVFSVFELPIIVGEIQFFFTIAAEGFGQLTRERFVSSAVKLWSY